MLKYAVLSLGLMVAPSLAQDSLNFDPNQLCAWQAANNGMDAGECVSLENDAKASLAGLDSTADAERKSVCVAEAKSFAGDSGFASYAVYAGCLKDGPGSL
jgi:hypothetical protein